MGRQETWINGEDLENTNTVVLKQPEAGGRGGFPVGLSYLWQGDMFSHLGKGYFRLEIVATMSGLKMKLLNSNSHCVPFKAESDIHL